jgi:hypothetical protein
VKTCRDKRTLSGNARGLHPSLPRKAILLLAALLPLAGCRHAPADAGSAETGRYSLENTEKFRLLDQPARLAIACTGLQERVNDAGRLELIANLQNRGADPVEMQVRCVFQDATGMATGDETPWLPLALDSYATEAVHYFATNPASRKFTIFVRVKR